MFVTRGAENVATLGTDKCYKGYDARMEAYC